MEEVAVDRSSFLVAGGGHDGIVLPLRLLDLICFSINICAARLQGLLLTVQCAIVLSCLTAQMPALNSSRTRNHASRLLATLLLIRGCLGHAWIVLLFVEW